jgi:feruloyl-CoA synthase
MMFAPVSLDVRREASGALTLQSREPLRAVPGSLIEQLRKWSHIRPNATFLAERSAQHWRIRTYGEVWKHTQFLASKLLVAGCSAERPLMILAPNSIEHAEVSLAAMRVGVPACPVSVAYASSLTDYARLRHVAQIANPAVLYVGGSAEFRTAGQAISDVIGALVSAQDWDSMRGADAVSLSAAESAVTADTVAKVLFTSGSTAKPKAVPNTHRMLCSNQAALAAIWPCLRREAPVLVDWLPWSHTFGGNFTFNLVLMHGGTYYIDAGKPVPALIGETVANLKDQSPTMYFNVPAGYDALLPFLASDRELRRSFFARLQFLFTAAAALPQSIKDRLQALAAAETGRSIPFASGWGSTETAPACTAIHFENGLASNIGVPIPGTVVRLVPNQDKLELRVKGPNVMSGYWRDSASTADAFDEDGFYKMGDAGRLVDDERPEKGIAFDGRISENFKLTSGTWVQVGTLRLAVIDAVRPFIQDVVVTGHDRDEVGLLIFLNVAACQSLAEKATSLAELAGHPEVVREIGAGLARLNKESKGGSDRIVRFLILDAPPNPDVYEITDKGYINQRAVLKHRADALERLYHSGECSLSSER